MPAVRRFQHAAVLTGIAIVLVACTPVAQAPATPVATPVVASTPSPSPTPTPTATKTPAAVVTPIAGAPDSGVVIHLVAKNNKWDTATLSAPAGKSWHAEIENQDAVGAGVPHNFVVESGRDVALRIFVSPRVQGGKTETFDIPALPAGSCLFLCTLHDNTMTGTLTLE